MSILDVTGMDLGHVAKCLICFIHEHRDDALLRGVPLTEDSVKGRRFMEEKGLWFLGDWTIQGVPSCFKALWGTDVAPGESVRVIVDIEQRENVFVVTDWDVEETF